MAFDFGRTFGKGFDSYKQLLKPAVQLGLILYLVPQLLFVLGFVVIVFVAIKERSDLLVPMIVTAVLLGIASLFFQSWYTASIIELTKKKDRIPDILSRSLLYVPRMLLLTLLLVLVAVISVVLPAAPGMALLANDSLPLGVGFFALGLLVGLIIMITVSVYWTLSPFAIVIHNAGVIDSLRTSFRKVRGSWWWVFFYVFIVFAIMMAVFIILDLLRLFAIPPSMVLEPTTEYLIILTVVSSVLQAVAMLFLTPFMLIILRPLYDVLKK